jgi:hypothetical protein
VHTTMRQRHLLGKISFNSSVPITSYLSLRLIYICKVLWQKQLRKMGKL